MSVILGEIDPLRVRRGNLGNLENNQGKAVQPREQSRLETCRVGPLPCPAPLRPLTTFTQYSVKVFILYPLSYFKEQKSTHDLGGYRGEEVTERIHVY